MIRDLACVNCISSTHTSAVISDGSRLAQDQVGF